MEVHRSHFYCMKKYSSGEVLLGLVTTAFLMEDASQAVEVVAEEVGATNCV